MEFFLGVGILLSVVGLGIAVLGAFGDIKERYVFGGFALACAPWILFIILLALGLMFGFISFQSNDPIEGQCYMAVGQDKYVNKVITREVELVQIRCP